MKKENKNNGLIAAVSLVAFVLWTVAVSFVDVRAIGAMGSSVGFAKINGFVHNLIGTNMYLYTITDWLGLIPIGVAVSFGILGLAQWIKRRNIAKVDYDILVLGGFYIVTLAVYLLFENIVINYRPILIEGALEISYPSSTTLLVMCIIPTAIMQFKSRIKNNILKQCVSALLSAFVAFMVIGRLISGVHWFTDIIGGALLSIGLVMSYRFVCGIKSKQ